MRNTEYLITALNTKLYGNRDWLLSCFSLTQYPIFEETEFKDLYPLQLVKSNTNPNALFFYENESITQLEDYKPNQPLMSYKDRIKLNPGDLKNVKEPVETTFGNCIFNALCIIHAFNDKIPFMVGKVNPGKLESMIADNLFDTPKEGEPRDNSKFYVDELVKHANAVTMLEALNFTCVPTTSEKTMLPNPAVIKRKKELLEKHKHELDSPAVIAAIQAELVALDKEYFKGDPAEQFYISGKAYNVSRMKKYGMMGYIGGIGDVKPALVDTSLADGWRKEYLPNYIDDIRAGSYARGKSTAIAGYGVKLAVNAFQTITISDSDCNVKSGLPVSVTEDNYGSLINRYKIVNGNPLLLTNENIRENIGQTIQIRTSMLCRNTPPSVCAICAGKSLAMHPNGVHIAASDINSIYMNITMKSMHGKSLSTKAWTILDDIK